MTHDGKAFRADMMHERSSPQPGDGHATSPLGSTAPPMYGRVPTRSGFDLARDMWSRRKWLATLVFVSVLAPALTMVRSVPDLYQSTATVLVEPQQVAEAVVRPSEAAVRSFWTNELETRLYTISQEMLSRARLEELITRFRLYPDLRRKAPEAAIERMRKDIKLQPREVGQTGVWGATIAFTLSYRGTDPATVAEVTNALASSYVEKNLRVRGRQVTSTTQFLQAQLEAATAKLDEQERKVQEFKQRHGSELPERFAILERLSTLVRQNAESQLGAMERRATLAKQLGDLEVSTGGPDNPSARLARLKTQLIELRQGYTDKYPEVMRLKAEIAALERSLGGSDPDGASGAPSGSTLRRLKQMLGDLDAQTKALKAEEQRLRREIETYQRGIEKAPEREQQLQALTRQYDSAKELHASLVKRYEDAKLGERMELQKGDQFRILDTAIPARNPTGPNRDLLMLYGLMLAVGMAVGAVVLAERLDTTLHTVEDLRVRTAVPVLVSIPRMITASDARRQRRRAKAAATAVALGLALMVGASAYIAHGNEQLAALLARGR
jgi:succinoglycan biosynthesis transport protein ExoP